jgi:hypothetical protein
MGRNRLGSCSSSLSKRLCGPVKEISRSDGQRYGMFCDCLDVEVKEREGSRRSYRF